MNIKVFQTKVALRYLNTVQRKKIDKMILAMEVKHRRYNYFLKYIKSPTRFQRLTRLRGKTKKRNDE